MRRWSIRHRGRRWRRLRRWRVKHRGRRWRRLRRWSIEHRRWRWRSLRCWCVKHCRRRWRRLRHWSIRHTARRWRWRRGRRGRHIECLRRWHLRLRWRGDRLRRWHLRLIWVGHRRRINGRLRGGCVNHVVKRGVHVGWCIVDGAAVEHRPWVNIINNLTHRRVIHVIHRHEVGHHRLGKGVWTSWGCHGKRVATAKLVRHHRRTCRSA